MVMKISDCGQEVERVAARVSGAQNVYGHETSIKDHSICVIGGTMNRVGRNRIRWKLSGLQRVCFRK